MPSKNSNNNKEVLKELEKKISPVLVINNSSLKPYVELFDYAPENIYQQPLGSLVGFFEIKEYSDDSAYVVNFLTSVLKKEYYINPKRPVTESLDSALHKVNMALSELAKHGNVEWLGKLNAAICVLEKNNTHFSVAGNAKIFLYRNQGLTEISEDLASDFSDPHPLKTFVNVSSGRLEKNDRLLITSEDIFHILSTLELKKNFQRFEGDKFVQFLKTALSNQMEMIASMVVEMNEVQAMTTPKAVSSKKSMETANVFSGTTFDNLPAVDLTPELPLTVINAPEGSAEYTDKKTGHIYVQGQSSEPSENPKVALYWESVKEKLGEAWYHTKNETRRKYSQQKKQLAKKIELRRLEKERLAEIKKEEAEREKAKRELQEIENERLLAEEKEVERILFEKQEAERKEMEALEQQRIAKQAKELENQRIIQEKKPISKQNSQSIQNPKKIIADKLQANHSEKTDQIGDFYRELSFQEKLQRAVKEQQRQAVIDLRSPQKDQTDETPIPTEDEISFSVPVHQQAEIERAKKIERTENMVKTLNKAICKTKEAVLSCSQAIRNQASEFASNKKIGHSQSEDRAHIAPRFSKIRKTFSSLSSKQKLYTLSGLALIFIVPFFIVKLTNKPPKPVAIQQPVKPLTQADILSGEKNIKINTDNKTIVSKNDLVAKTLLTNIGLVAFTKNSVLVFDANNQFKEYPIGAGQGSIVNATFMSDLSLVLIMTDQSKIISFSPISLKFADNNINITNKVNQSFLGTYLTYLYVLDTEAGQIYRYPRAEGGFGEKTDWLKSETTFSKASDMTIDDNIYVIESGKVMKFFKGLPQVITFESSQTSINYDKISTSIDSSSLYVLDKLNARIVQFSKEDGSIVSQYYNEKLKDGASLTVDEKNNVAYVTTSNGLISTTLQ
ncbi:MAG: hypothetical protein ACD_56C00091G0001 [uncultured bacterium]|nr:MAG: hypothetical protein ACD_56C00091G0001 [uncultured bacterium]